MTFDHGTTTLPWCAFESEGQQRVGVGVGTQLLDVAAAVPELAEACAGGLLDGVLALDKSARASVRSKLQDVVASNADEHLTPVDAVTLVLPWTVGDYVDFYASENHASNLGKLFRPDSDALTPNWKHLPIGYHGRAGTVVVSGTEIKRPSGQRRPPGAEVQFGPSVRLDIEAEVGFVVGGPATREPLSLAEAEDRIAGVCLVNDWSARDIQAWEYVPLGPFLGKSFATSVSPWIVPIEALAEARVEPPTRDVPLQDYLDDAGVAGGFDLAMEVRLNGELVSSPPYASMYWTPAQMLAHMCVNGASIRPGDLFASGTVSGPEVNQRGAFIEMTWNGAEPITLADGSTRTFLDDGDTVSITATAPGPDGTRIQFGSVDGTISHA